jgi:hypothetical protein
LSLRGRCGDGDFADEPPLAGLAEEFLGDVGVLGVVGDKPEVDVVLGQGSQRPVTPTLPIPANGYPLLP